jgi:outer membrane protein assembly factor BamB
VATTRPVEPPAAANWPQWHGPNRDNKSPDRGLLKQWPAGGPKLAATLSGLHMGYSSPVIVDGKIYTTGVHEGRLVIQAFDGAGRRKWDADGGPAYAKRFAGSRSTPTVIDGRLYVLSGTGQVGCFEAATGREVWTVQIREKFKGRGPVWGYAESVLVNGGKVICSPGGPEAALVALHAKTGRLAWRTAFDDEASYGSAILREHAGQRQILTMTAKYAVGVDPTDGQLLWSHLHGGKRGAGHMAACTMVFLDGGLYCSVGHGIGGRKLDLQRSEKTGRFDAVQVWVDKNLDNLHGGLVLVDGHIYGSRFFPSKRGGWVCLDFKTGRMKHIAKGVGRGAVTYADGMLYCLSTKGTMGLVKAEPARHEVISSFRVPTGGEGPYWAHPVVIGGRLYVRHADKLFVYDVRT